MRKKKKGLKILFNGDRDQTNQRDTVTGCFGIEGGELR